MKKLRTLIIIGLLVFSCKPEEKQTDTIISGSAPGVYNGIRVYLKVKDFKTKRETPIDTAIVMNEKFSFENKSKQPQLTFLTVDNVAGNLTIITEPTDMSVTINKFNIKESTVTGSTMQTDYENYEATLREIQNKYNRNFQNYRNASRRNETNLRDSLTYVLNSLKKQLAEFPVNYIKDNPNKALCLILIEQEIQKSQDNVKYLKVAFDALNEDLKNSDKGRIIGEKLNTLFQVTQRTKQLQIGEKAPNFEAPNPNGDIVSLEAIRGKVTIIDFWAAWCGPCRRENPNVVKVYNKYQEKGLEIIGVSLDGQGRQSDPKKAWTDAIEKDNLTWHQVSHLQYFNDPVAQLYNIQSIPATYILDSEGKIAAKNLRGRALELKVQELLNE